MNELVKKIALLTTGLVIGAVVGRKGKTKKHKTLTISSLDSETLIEFNQNGIHFFEPETGKPIGSICH